MTEKQLKILSKKENIKRQALLVAEAKYKELTAALVTQAALVKLREMELNTFESMYYEKQ